MTPAAGSALDAWRTLVQAALLGGAREVGESAGGPPSSLLGAIDVRERESGARRLLARAAVLSTYARAGRLPDPATLPIDAPAPPDADDLPLVPPAAATLLTTMLGGQHRELLPEWLARAAQRGRRVPPTMLPAVLDLGRALAAPVRPALVAVLGARGAWLAARNADWSWALATRSVESARAIWETGAPAERAAALAVLRDADAADARDRLTATWRTESAAARATLLAALETALGVGDEPFLEAALDDRSREVRIVAAGLLAMLPTSALVARMTARAHAMLAYEPGGLLRRARLVVTLPTAPESEAVRDGVIPAPPAGVGERAWWLAQTVAVVPPRTFTEAWGVAPARAIELAQGTEWSEALVDAWARGALRAPDAAWAEALLRSNALVDRHARLAPPRAQLLGVLPAERRDALLDEALAGRVAIDPIDLLAGAPAPWSARLARAALAWMRRRATAVASQPDARPADDWRVIERFATIGVQLPTPMLAEAADGWPDALPPAWSRALERFQTVLATRRAIDAAFTSADATAT